MAFTPTYGSVFCYGAAHAPDKLRLSGKAPSSPGAGARWYGDTPDTDANGTPYGGGDYGEPVDQWNSITQPGVDPVWGNGYPVGPVTAAWVPNTSWLYGVPLVDGTYSRIIQSRWIKIETLENPEPD